MKLTMKKELQFALHFPLSQQLRIEARDLAMNRKTDEKKLRYKINRNRNAPVFQPSIYSRTILETRRPGVEIVKVTATDNDEQVH